MTNDLRDAGAGREGRAPTASPQGIAPSTGSDSAARPPSVIRHASLVIRRWGPRVLGVALFVWAVAAVGPGNVWRGLRAADWRPVAPAALAALPFIYVKAWRWARILAGLDIAVPLGAAFRYYSIGLWAGQVTPGQAGDFVKAWYVRARGAPLERALLSALLDRLFDFAALFAVGAAALLAFANDPRTLALVVAALVAVCAALAAAMTARWRAPLLALLGRVTPAALRDRAGRSAALRSLAAAQLDARHLAPVLALTAASWVLSLARIYLCFRAVGVRLSLLDFLLVSALTTLASLISIGGVGTRDVDLLALLAPFGYDGAQALAVSFLILALTISNMVPGFLIWLREPVPLRRVGTLIENED